MSKVTSSIGLKFERFTQEVFPDLRFLGNNPNIPDFYHPDLDFWVEAKVGNIEWGVRIKRNQIENFRDFQRPIIYAIGLHSFDHAHKRLTQITERGRQNYLDKMLEIKEVHFITSEVMERLWRREKRWNERETIEYCMIKRSTLINVYEDRQFRRRGRRYTPQSYYGFNRSGFFVSNPKENSELLPFGAILDPIKDRDFISYLKQTNTK